MRVFGVRGTDAYARMRVATVRQEAVANRTYRTRLRSNAASKAASALLDSDASSSLLMSPYSIHLESCPATAAFPRTYCAPGAWRGSV